MPRRLRNPQRVGSGGGGGFASFLASVAGAPPVIEGGDITNQIDPEVDLGTNNAPIMEPYRVSKPNFFSKMSGGNQQYADLSNTLKFAEMDNLSRQNLANVHNQGQMQLEQFRSANDLKQVQEAAKLREEENRRTEQAALKKFAWENSTTPEEYENFIKSPEAVAAFRQKFLADAKKQDVLNRKGEADILDSQAKRPTLGFLDVREGNAMVDPLTGRTIYNAAPQKEAPEVRGGPVDFTIPQYKGGTFAKVPGGVNREIGAFNPSSSGEGYTNQPSQTMAPVKDNSFQGVLSPLLKKLPTSLGTQAGATSFEAPSFVPSGGRPEVIGQPDPFDDFQDAPPIMGGSVSNSAPAPTPTPEGSLLNPQFKKDQFMQDFGPVLQPLLNVPLIQDYLKKRGMFQRKQ